MLRGAYLTPRRALRQSIIGIQLHRKTPIWDATPLVRRVALQPCKKGHPSGAPILNLACSPSSPSVTAGQPETVKGARHMYTQSRA